MDDLGICKRIADINGDNVSMMKSALGPNWMIASEGHAGYKSYNPLTDDALCFKLMVKYGVSVDFIRPLEVNIGSGACIGFREKPNKAICLAIIGANKQP